MPCLTPYPFNSAQKECPGPKRGASSCFLIPLFIDPPHVAFRRLAMYLIWPWNFPGFCLAESSGRPEVRDVISRTSLAFCRAGDFRMNFADSTSIC